MRGSTTNPAQNDTHLAPFSLEASTIDKINQLHAEIRQHVINSQNLIDAALLAAWQAGRLLIKEKARVRRYAGRGAWIPWLKESFRGSVRTAQRYMLLARRVTEPSLMKNISLRQAYLRLGIAIASKSSNSLPLQKLPAHVTLSARLTRILRRQRRAAAGNLSLLRNSPELIALYEQLRTLFEKPHAT